MKAVEISLLIYAILVTMGGIIGFLKAKSKVSLLSGIVSGAILLTAYSVSNRNFKDGCLFGLITTGVLLAVFSIRLAKTKKFMPSGLMLILSAIESCLLVYGFIKGI